MGMSVSRGAVEEMGEELVGGTVNHFAAELAKGRTWEEAAASYLEGLPTNLATAGVMGGGSGARTPSSPPGRQPQPNSQSDGLPRLQFSRGQTSNARQQTQQNLAESAIQSIIDHDNTPIQSSSRLHPDRSGGNAQTSRESTRALLGTSTGTIPGWAGAAGQRRRAEAERAYLERHATPPGDKGVLFGKGGEHYVYHRDGEDFVTKATHGGKYGQVLDQMGPDEGYRFNLRPASPSEYLARIGLTNQVFGDDIQIVGYEQTPDGPSIVTTQALLEGPHPDEKQTEAFLRAHGFEPMDERLYDDKTLNFVKRPWYRAKDGVVVVDAKPQNFVLHKGKVMPVDLMIQLLPDDVLNLTKSARQRQYSLADGERQDGSNGPTLGSYFGNDSGKLGQEVIATTQLWQEKQPGLLNESTHVFDSAEELMNSDYAKQHPFTDEEKAAMRGAEGFFDASTGRTVIIAGNVGLRPGETPQGALTRVMLHERVGHDGLGLLLNAPGDRPGKPNINRERWDNLQKHIPSHLTEAIGNQPGYEHLKGNPEALALEWFAREAEARPELLTQPSLVMRMWDNFKQGVVDLMARLLPGWRHRRRTAAWAC